MQEAR